MKNLVVSLFLLAIITSGCQFFGGGKQAEKEVKNPDGTFIKKTHFNNDPNSPVEWELSLKVNEAGETVRHGLNTRYSKTGKVYERINYVDNKKHGERLTYHTTGKVWKEQNYVNGNLHGDCKRYDRQGKLTAEYNYANGLVGVGLKEYTNLGVERKQPQLKIERIDQLKSGNKYLLRLSLAGENVNRIKSVEYYLGDLVEGKYFHKNMKPANRLSDKMGELVFTVPKGNMLKDAFNIVAVAKNTDGMSLVLQEKVSINVSN